MVSSTMKYHYVLERSYNMQMWMCMKLMYCYCTIFQMLSNVRQSDTEVFGDCAGWFDYLQQICVIHTLNGQHVHMHPSLYNHAVLKITYCKLFLLSAVNFKIVVMKVAAHACRPARFAYISRH